MQSRTYVAIMAFCCFDFGQHKKLLAVQSMNKLVKVLESLECTQVNAHFIIE